MTRAALVLLALGASGATVMVAASSPPAFERGIRLPGPGWVGVRLDREVYEGARADLGDLRIVDDRGVAVAYVIDRGGPVGSTPARRPAIRNRGVVRGVAATAVLDFGERVRKRCLTLQLPGRNFRRGVTVEGSHDGRTWTTLIDEAWVFAVPGPPPARYETVALPDNDFALLRVTVHHGPDDRERIAIEDAWVPEGPAGTVREDPLGRPWSRAEEPRGRETWLGLELGARHQPFQAVLFDVEDERFFREVAIEARVDPSPPGPHGAPAPVTWRELRRGVIYRLEHDGRLRESLRLETRGRERALRLRIRNGDDQPLCIRNVTVLAPVERLIFEAEPGRQYRLTYAVPDLAPPDYDLARTVGREPWTLVAADATLDPVTVRRGATGDERPWTERHPALLWVGLLAVVAALGALTWRALRHRG